jgi:mono/diheme cytochrome c family protein
MTVETTRDLRFAGVKMIGLNCAACHTAQFEVRGQPVLRVDGGTNLFDVSQFRVALMKATQKTIDNPVEFVGFVSRLVRHSTAKDLSLIGGRAAKHPLALRMSADLHKVFDVVEGPEKVIGDKLRELLRQELQEKPADLTRGIITRSDDPRLKGATEKARTESGGLNLSIQDKGPFRLFTFLTPADASKVAALTIEDALTTLRLLRARLELLKDSGHPVLTPAGPGRVDAFGEARNKVFPDFRGPLDAPVRYPFLWPLADGLHWYHWDGNTNSRQERNTGEALGVGVVVDPVTRESTLRFQNLVRLEELAMKLKPPVWPEAAFGKIDAEKAARGARHFEKFCAKCHAGPGADGATIVPLESLKTDGQRVRNIRQPLGKDNVFDVLSPILKEVITKAGGEPEGKENKWRPSTTNQPNLPLGYANRPLRAVWASPPYLHNGSVPNLYQLLLPAEKRDKQFPLGHREYDPQHLGYVLQPARVIFLFDTRLTGNANSGHSGPDYGTDQLGEPERWELIEFLKSR